MNVTDEIHTKGTGNRQSSGRIRKCLSKYQDFILNQCCDAKVVLFFNICMRRTCCNNLDTNVSQEEVDDCELENRNLKIKISS